MTDETSLAAVQLLEWSEALNRDLRKELTVTARSAQAIVEQRVQHNRLTMRNNLINVEASWRVTVIRKGPFAGPGGLASGMGLSDLERWSLLALVPHPDFWTHC